MLQIVPATIAEFAHSALLDSLEPLTEFANQSTLSVLLGIPLELALHAIPDMKSARTDASCQSPAPPRELMTPTAETLLTVSAKIVLKDTISTKMVFALKLAPSADPMMVEETVLLAMLVTLSMPEAVSSLLIPLMTILTATDGSLESVNHALTLAT